MAYGVTILMSARFPLAMGSGMGHDEGMKCRFCVALVIAAVAFMAAAQGPQGQVPGLGAAMTKLFGDNQAFSAQATATILDADGKQSMKMPMNYAVLDGRIRTEVDMTQVQSKALEGTAASLKQMGMDRTVSIVRPDQQKQLIIYPSMRAYIETPLTNAAAGNTNQGYKIDSTPLGKETIDGHPCEKKKVTVLGPDGEKQEAIVWNATDMRNFPVKMEMKQADMTTVMTYSNVKFDKPDARLFDAPTGFDRYDGMEKLTQTAIMKLLGTPRQR
jgi:hypothetical protein